MDDETRAMQTAIAAAALENEAMKLDRAGSLKEAAGAYRDSAAKLLEAAAACPEQHPDGPVLEHHAREVLARAIYLEGVEPGSEDVISLEEHINSVQLTMGSAPPEPRPRSGSGIAPAAAAPAPSSYETGGSSGSTSSASTASAAGGGSTSKKGDSKVMGTAAAIGGAAGLLLMGPLSAVAVGATAAYATTREDKAGSAVRKVSSVSLKAADKVRGYVDDDNRMTNRVSNASSTAVNNVKAIDERYGVSNKAKRATTSTHQALVNFNNRHQVGDKLSRGLDNTASALSSGLSRVFSRSS